mmetsp:Transcript_50510/g.101603  ORF Transcript_50510/g.101603 Transcript_50510/m.101603 type:complete len:219 (-) Transcript_50510:204-860(-)
MPAPLGGQRGALDLFGSVHGHTALRFPLAAGGAVKRFGGGVRPARACARGVGDALAAAADWGRAAGLRPRRPRARAETQPAWTIQPPREDSRRCQCWWWWWWSLGAALWWPRAALSLLCCQEFALWQATPLPTQTTTGAARAGWTNCRVSPVALLLRCRYCRRRRYPHYQHFGWQQPSKRPSHELRTLNEGTPPPRGAGGTRRPPLLLRHCVGLPPCG